VSVFLVGAGPGVADLMTLRAARLVARADVIIHDRLVDASVLATVRSDAVVIDVGKRRGSSPTQRLINEMLVDFAKRYECVVRLKGGDPFVFGRGGEEWLALNEAGVAVEVVPGVTSALSGPLAAGIPVTHRGVSRGVIVITGHGADGDFIDVAGLSRGDLTLVILMGVEGRARLARDLMEEGRGADTPVAVVERAWTNRQLTTRSTLGNLADLDVHAPAVIVVGEVAAFDFSRALEGTRAGAA